jgi:RNA ligase
VLERKVIFNMKYDLKPFYELVEHGLLRTSELGDLVLFNYTDKCTYEKAWNEFTSMSRGLILNKHTGEVVAKCLPKFHNLGETVETQLANLPLHLSHTVHEKVDGSLGIVFFHDGDWRVATRGSFYSDQAEKAKEMLSEYRMPGNQGITLLVEIIYPENKIIVNYGNEEKLVLLAAYDVNTCEELPYSALEDISLNTGLQLADKHELGIEELKGLQKTLPLNREGFVVRFDNGLRVKIKGDEYMRIARIISNLSPLSLWETMDDGKVDRKYLSQLPEEFRIEFESITSALEIRYKEVMTEVALDYEKLPCRGDDRESKKAVALFLAKDTTIKHKKIMFAVLQSKHSTVDSYVKDFIRPHSNVLENL